MTYETQERFFKYVYLAFGFVFVTSLLVLAFMKGIAPFNLTLSWSGSSMVLTQYQTEPAVGKRVAEAGSLEGQVALYRVQEAYRQGGELYYNASALVGEPGSEVLLARDAQRVVIASIPVLGLWVRALGHPIGALALLGIPLLTFALDLLLASSALVSFQALRTAFRDMMHRAEHRRMARRMEEESEQEEYDEPNTTMYPEPEAPQNFGMTIHLSRPRRYSI